MAKHGPDEGWRQHVLNNVLPRMEATAEPATSLTNAPPSFGFQTLQPQHDPIEGLPPAAAEKLRLLRDRSRDAHALCVPFSDIQEANTLKNDAERAYRRLVDHPQDGGYNIPETDRRAISAQQHIAKVTDDLRRLNERSELRALAWRAASAPLAACEDFLRHGVPGGCKLEAIETEPPPLKKGEGILDAVEARRRRVRELRADLHRIRSAPFPSSYAKQRMRAQVEALAQRGAPSVSRLVELDGPVDFQTQSLTSEVHAERRSLAFTETADALALVAWLHRDALIAALDREISTESDDAASLSHEARQKAEAEVQGDLLDVERTEAALVFAAWEQGLACDARSDISPLALLQVQLITAPRAPSGPSSPGHSYNLIGGR